MMLEFAMLLLSGIGIIGGLLLFHIANEEIAPGRTYFRFLLSALFLIQAILLMLSKKSSSVAVESWMVYAGVAVGFFVASLIRKPFAVVGGSVGIGSGLSFFPSISGIAFLLMMILTLLFQEKKSLFRIHFHCALWFFVSGIIFLLIPSETIVFSVLNGVFVGGCLFHCLQFAKPMSLSKSD